MFISHDSSRNNAIGKGCEYAYYDSSPNDPDNPSPRLSHFVIKAIHHSTLARIPPTLYIRPGLKNPNKSHHHTHRNPTRRDLQYLRHPRSRHRLRQSNMIRIEIIHHIGTPQKRIALDRRQTVRRRRTVNTELTHLDSIQ